MRRVAVFVDAGYFWVQTGKIVVGKPAKREQITLNYEELHAKLLDETRNQFKSIDLLRVYWYDGPGQNGKTEHHKAIENLDDFKLRLGTRNGEGAQKAVDGLIIADMISLSQSKAISDALLISGDADLAPGVIAAQNLGIRIHLLSMGSSDATSPYLRTEVDFKSHWDDVIIKSFASEHSKIKTPTEVTVSTASVVAKPVNTILRDCVEKVHAEFHDQITATIGSKEQIPTEIDKKLLSCAKELLGRSLEEQERRQIRIEFKKILIKK